MAKIYVNGSFVPEAQAVVSVFDHGLLYGDGVFEGIRAYNGYVFKLDEHLDRFYASARAIALEIPLSRKEMREAILETLRVNDLREAYIRPVVTRGVGDLGIDPRRCDRPTVIIIPREWKTLYGEDLYERGLRAIVVAIRNKAPESLPPNVKSLNYLTNVLARIEANVWGADEAIMLDVRGNVSEGSADNLFVVDAGQVYTPPVMNNLPGITRATVIDILAEADNPVQEEYFGIAKLYMADEVFVTGTAAEVIPVVEIDGRPIGDGRPGALTRSIRERFKQITGVPETGTAIYE
ncbi:MAG: branched-chain-amino-acid transaminase [Candidatus Bipolaricaulia bacterium]